MQVIWFDTEDNEYKNGSYQKFRLLIEKNPKKILPLERFNNIAESTVINAVKKLNEHRHRFINEYQ